MKSLFILAAIIPLITACGSSEPSVAQAFPDLKQDGLEIRMGYLPELGDVKCDRNMYAGYRTDQTTAVTFNIKMFVNAPGTSMVIYDRQLTLSPMQKGYLGGQTRLFPAPIEASCKTVNVKMTSMYCTYGPDNERRACPKTIRWNWLQGFKMIETPTER